MFLAILNVFVILEESDGPIISFKCISEVGSHHSSSSISRALVSHVLNALSIFLQAFYIAFITAQSETFIF